ncbi:MAG: hypothetical protein AAB373_01625 [Patescibacteria group bacterium]
MSEEQKDLVGQFLAPGSGCPYHKVQYQAALREGTDNQLTERAVASIPTIEQFWRNLSLRRESFEVDLSGDSDVVSGMINAVQSFVGPDFVTAINIVSADPAQMSSIVKLQSGLVLENDTPENFLKHNIQQGDIVVFDFVELVFKYVRDHQKSGMTLDLDNLRKFANGNIKKLCYEIACRNALREHALLDAVTVAYPGRRRLLDVNSLEEYNSDRGLDLRLTAPAYAKFHGLFEEYNRGVWNSPGKCPASEAYGLETTVLLEYLDWLFELTSNYYFPEMLRRHEDPYLQTIADLETLTRNVVERSKQRVRYGGGFQF